LLFWFPYKYQYDPNRKATFYPENHKLELIWTVIPAIVLTVLVIGGYRTWTDITAEAPKGAHIIEIMGKQFAWQVRYPGKDSELGKYNFKLIDSQNEFGLDFRDKANYDDFIPRELHLPKGEPVLLKIRARDVLHSVFAPHFRLKMDAVPGMPTKFWFVPRTSTQEMREKLNDPEFNYELACTEVCGRGHFAMKFIIVVDEPEDYAKWYASQDPWIKQNPDYLKVFKEKTFITDSEKKPVIEKTISLN
jgi:cytochrome c oxidase subunit 2